MKPLKQWLSKTLAYTPEQEYHFTLPETQEEQMLASNLSGAYQKEQKMEDNNKPKDIFPSLSVNLEYMKVVYNSMINSDINIREFTLTAKSKEYKAFILYIDGMVDSKTINDFVLEPLMLKNLANLYQNDKDKIVRQSVSSNITVKKVKKFDLVEHIYQSLMPQNNVKKISKFDPVISGVNAGNCVLFVDTITIAFDLDVKGFKQRSVDTPNNELVIKGPQEGFVEAIRTNTSLLRRGVNNENLVIESIAIGNVSHTQCAVCYLKNITNNDLVAEVKYRLNNLDVDSLLSSGQLEQLIEETNHYSIPKILSTERPDKCTKYLYEGRVVVLVNGNPYSLIMPATLIDFMSSPEDTNLKFQFANMLKMIRILATVLTLLLPGFYLAITNFHQELIPTELLFSILASRENVPFPIIFEILVMEISFELIREAGLRVPSPIGPTIGIVGALVLRTSSGQCWCS